MSNVIPGSVFGVKVYEKNNYSNISSYMCWVFAIRSVNRDKGEFRVVYEI